MKFDFNVFAPTPSGCPTTLTYELRDAGSDSSNLQSNPTGLNQPTITGSPYSITPVDVNSLNTYTFYLKVTGSEGLYSYNKYFGPYILIVVCSPISAVTVISDSSSLVYDISYN